MTTAVPTLIRKTYPAEVKVLDAVQGIVEAYVNTLERTDFDDEIIMDGAFDRYVERGGKLPKVAWFHQQWMPIGKTLETQQRGKRQRIVAQFNLATQRGREAFSDIEFGAVDEWSVGFYTLELDEDYARQRKVQRAIKELDWVEYSPVMRGASPGTGTIGTKDGGDDLPPAPDAQLPAPPDLAADDPAESCEHCGASYQQAIGDAVCEAAGADGGVHVWVQAAPPAETKDGQPPDETNGHTPAYADGAAKLLEQYRRHLISAGIDIPLVVAKAGARNSVADQRRVQAAHDLMVELGAMCEEGSDEE